MKPRGASITGLATVALALGIQALVLLLALAWLSRAVPVEEVGRLAAYLTLFGFATGLDGVRQAAVVASANLDVSEARRVAASFGWLSLRVGCGAVLICAIAGVAAFGLSATLVIGLFAPIACYYAASPSLALLESTKGPEWSISLQSAAVTVAVAAICSLVALGVEMTTALWFFSVGPLAALGALFISGSLIRPRGRLATDWRLRARHGVVTNLSVSVVAAADRTFAALLGGAGLLGLYAPLAEAVHRAIAAGGLITNFFLVSEARSAMGKRVDGNSLAHEHVVRVAICVGCVGAIAAAYCAESIATLLLGRSDPDVSLALQIALVPAVTSLGANWGATILRAMGQFDIYRGYLVCLAIAAVTALWAVPHLGIVGVSLTLLLLRLPDLPLLSRATRLRRGSQSKDQPLGDGDAGDADRVG